MSGRVMELVARAHLTWKRRLARGLQPHGVGPKQLFVLRQLCYHWTFSRLLGTSTGAHVLAAPMLTIGAVAVEVMTTVGADQRAIAWVMAASLSLTLAASFPRTGTGATLAESEPVMAAPQAWDRVNATPPIAQTAAPENLKK